MGLLATKKDDSDLAEALHLEAVLVLDRLPEVWYYCTATVNTIYYTCCTVGEVASSRPKCCGIPSLILSAV